MVCNRKQIVQAIKVFWFLTKRDRKTKQDFNSELANSRSSLCMRRRWVFVVEVCATKSDKTSLRFCGTCLKLKPQSFVIRGRVKEMRNVFITDMCTRAIRFRYYCVK